MPIEFLGSPDTTLGIELELGIVDRSSRSFVAGSNEVLDELARRTDGVEAKVKHELFQCTLEVITGICPTVAAARDDLEGSLRAVRSLLDPKGLALIGSGTHPFADWRNLAVSPEPRYVELVESIQWPARRLAIHGVHFHVGVPSGEHAIAVVRSLASRHLPLFLALSASSPYWLGVDTGMASSRTKIFEGLPTAGLPPRLSSWIEFERLMDGLLHADVIASIREVWWDCRPHPDFGTVELRMCDGITNLDEVSSLAALAQSLVTDLIERRDAGEPVPEAPEWVMRENKWLAARYGLDCSILVDEAGHRRPVAELVHELVDTLGPTAQRLGCATELEGIERVLERGPSYRRQRQVRAARGELVDVVDALVREHEVGLR